MLFAQKQILLAGLEGGGYGVDPTLVPADAIFAQNLNLAPMAGSTADRNRAWPTFGADAKAHVGTYQTLSFDVELVGGGAAGTPPHFGALLRACGLAETINVGVSAVYDPVSSGQESAALYSNGDGRLHKMLGGMGTASLKLSGAQLPMIGFQMSGLFGLATDTAIPAGVAAVLKALPQSIEVNKVNTPTFTLGGYSPVIESIQIDLGNKVVFRDRPNAAKIALTDRLAGGQIQFELPTVAAKDFLSDAKAGTLMPLQIIHGTVAGNIVQIGAPKVQLISPTYTTVEDIAHFSAQLNIVRDNGDDELKLTVK